MLTLLLFALLQQPKPEYKWVVIKEAEFELSTLSAPQVELPKRDGSLRIRVQSDSAISVAILPSGDAQVVAMRPSLTQFGRLRFAAYPCSQTWATKVELECTPPFTDRVLLLKDQRQAGTAALAGATIAIGTAAVVKKASAINKVKVTVWDLECINCAPTTTTEAAR